MEKKKLLHALITLIVFIALAVGANCVSGWSGFIIVLAMALLSGQAVWLYGREWKDK